MNTEIIEALKKNFIGDIESKNLLLKERLNEI
jgi:hypothetical protein